MWVQRARRDRAEREVRGLVSWIKHLSEIRAAETIDLELDAYVYLAAIMILLEETEGLAEALIGMSRVFRSVEEGMLKEASALSERYEQLAMHLQSASQKTSRGLPTIFKTTEVMHLLTSE